MTAPAALLRDVKKRRTTLGYQAAQNRLKPLTPLRGVFFFCNFSSGQAKEKLIKKNEKENSTHHGTNSQ